MRNASESQGLPYLAGPSWTVETRVKKGAGGRPWRSGRIIVLVAWGVPETCSRFRLPGEDLRGSRSLHSTTNPEGGHKGLRLWPVSPLPSETELPQLGSLATDKENWINRESLTDWSLPDYRSRLWCNWSTAIRCRASKRDWSRPY